MAAPWNPYFTLNDVRHLRMLESLYKNASAELQWVMTAKVMSEVEYLRRMGNGGEQIYELLESGE